MRTAALWAFTLAAGFLATLAGLALKLNVLIVLTLALLLAGVVFYLLDYRTRPDRRVFLKGVTPVQLMGLFRERTEVQAEKAATIYIGKWMRVSGTVRDVTTHGPRNRTVFLDGRDQPFLSFRRKLSQVDILHKGDTIHVVGCVDQIAAHHIFLKDCEMAAERSVTQETA